MFEGIEECLSLKDVTETCEVEVRMGIITVYIFVNRQDGSYRYEYLPGGYMRIC
jgi:hypothetical protein